MPEVRNCEIFYDNRSHVINNIIKRDCSKTPNVRGCNIICITPYSCTLLKFKTKIKNFKFKCKIYIYIYYN